MKVIFKYGISAYSGTIDEMVYQKWFQGRICLSRRFTYPEITAANTHAGAITKNLRSVYKNAASGYIDDLKAYARLNKKQHRSKYAELMHPMPSAPALFLHMMTEWAKTDPLHIDLTAVTIADIITMDAEVRTIERAIDAGYLVMVTPYTDLNNDIQ